MIPGFQYPLGRCAASQPTISQYGQHGAVHWTQERLWAAVDGFRRLIEARTRPGTLVLVVSDTRPVALALFLAGIAAGRLVSFFPPQNPIQDADHFTHQQRAAIGRIDPGLVLVTAAGMRDALTAISPELGPRILLCDTEPPSGAWERGRAAFLAQLADVEAARPLFVQHSSGTTGVKKACAIGADQLRAQFESYWCRTVRHALSETPRIATWLPLYHDMGLVATFLLPLLDGAPIAFVDPFEWVGKPQQFLDVIAAERPSLCWMPNFAFRHYVRLQRFLRQRDLSSVRAWVNCSEPCRALDAQAFEDGFAAWGVISGSVVGCYAMAETVFAATQAVPGRRLSLAAPSSIMPGQAVGPERLREGRLADEAGQDAKLVLSSGPALPGAEVRAYVDGMPAGHGTYGELGIRAPFNFHGYRGRTAAESGLLADGTYMTGDLGVVLEGEVFVFGRLKEIIIVSGKNLHAGDVEAAASGIAGIKPGRAVAFGVENAATGTEDLVVIAERDPKVEAPPDALRAELTRVLHGLFLVSPHDVRIVESRWLVKSTSGKVSRDANRTKYLAERHGRAAPEAPQRQDDAA